MTRRALNPRRKSITLRDIVPPATLATDLYLNGYKPGLDILQRAAERLAAEYERSLSAIVTDAPIDLTRILDDAEQELTRLLFILRPSMRSWAIRIERWQRGRWVGAVLAASKVDLSTLIGPDDVKVTLDQLIERNVGLVKDVGAQARQRMQTAVFEGLRNRTPAREVAKAIGEAQTMARDRSLRIASDQLSKATSALASERRRQAGLDVYEWRHSAKSHPRSWHRARNGNLYTDNPDRVGAEVDGKTVAAEVDPNDRPGASPYCGCRERSVLVFS